MPKSLPKTKPWLSMGLKAAILAAPLMVMAPSEAATVSTTINGFTGQFAPANWQLSPSGVNGTAASFQDSNTTIRIAKNANADVNGIAFASTIINDALFTSLKPALAGNLVGYSYSYNWLWFTSNNTNANFVFQNLAPSSTLNTSNGTSTNPLTGIFSSGLIAGSSFNTLLGFQVDGLNTNPEVGTGQARISNFQFIANYDDAQPIPGPLPILGAGAAFGFSRKLRRRLNSAKALA